MAIPLSTDLISIYRAPDDGTGDTDALPDTEPTYELVTTGIRAAFGQAIRAAGLLGHEEREILRVRFSCDPTDIRRGDMVRDSSGRVWEMLWVDERTGIPGFDYVRGVAVHRELELSAGLPLMAP